MILILLETDKDPVLTFEKEFKVYFFSINKESITNFPFFSFTFDSLILIFKKVEIKQPNYLILITNLLFKF